MAVNKPVKKGTNQTEKKATGLLANVGDYSGKTLNLTKKQLGSAGMKAASTRKIAISRTTYDKATKKVLGPMGKPITGRVDLGGGNIAVYKNGVRVRAQKSSSGPKASGGGGGGGGGGKGTGAGKPYEERKGTVGGNATLTSPGRPGAFPRTQGQVPARPKPSGIGYLAKRNPSIGGTTPSRGGGVGPSAGSALNKAAKPASKSSAANTRTITLTSNPPYRVVQKKVNGKWVEISRTRMPVASSRKLMGR